jgi:hypothetical protein
MAARQTVMFTASNSMTYIFDSVGVWKIRTDDLDNGHFSPTFPPTRVWSIIDAGAEKKPLRGPHTAFRFFTVFATSPQLDRYHEFTKKPSVFVWIMDPWALPELYALYVSAILPFGLKPDHYQDLSTAAGDIIYRYTNMHRKLWTCPTRYSSLPHSGKRNVPLGN